RARSALPRSRFPRSTSMASTRRSPASASRRRTRRSISPWRACARCERGADAVFIDPAMPSELLTERRGTTLVLTISDAPTRNTLSAQVIAAGIEALGVAESDPEVRCVVLQGAGGHFCAGGNVQGLVDRRAAGE